MNIEEIMKIIFVIVGFVMAAIGVIAIFDARKITKKWFSFGDRNDGVRTLKIIGFIVAIIGGILIVFGM